MQPERQVLALPGNRANPPAVRSSALIPLAERTESMDHVGPHDEGHHHEQNQVVVEFHRFILRATSTRPT